MVIGIRERDLGPRPDGLRLSRSSYGLVDRVATHTDAQRPVATEQLGAGGAGDGQFGYDGAGNRVRAGSTTYTFDARGRLTGGSDGRVQVWSQAGLLLSDSLAGSVKTLAHDGFGRRVAEQVGATSRTFSYDGLDRVIGSGGEVFSYSGVGIDPVKVGATKLGRSAGGRLVSERDGAGAARLLGSDRHGDVVWRTATNGSLVDSTSFDPWGVSTATSSTGFGVAFQGDVTSGVSGDVWMGARWYSPTTASFTSRDSIDDGGRFGYGGGDPLGRWDPDGRMSISVGSLEWVRGSLSATGRAVLGASLPDMSGKRERLAAQRGHSARVREQALDRQRVIDAGPPADLGMSSQDAKEYEKQLEAFVRSNVEAGCSASVVEGRLGKPVWGMAGYGEQMSAYTRATSLPCSWDAWRLPDKHQYFQTQTAINLKVRSASEWAKLDWLERDKIWADEVAPKLESWLAGGRCSGSIDVPLIGGLLTGIGQWACKNPETLEMALKVDLAVLTVASAGTLGPVAAGATAGAGITGFAGQAAYQEIRYDRVKWGDAADFGLFTADATSFGLGIKSMFNSFMARRAAAQGLTNNTLSPLRQAYVDEVAGMPERIVALRRAGLDSEAIAREVSATRRALGVKYKDLTPPEELAKITARNIKEYGDPLGPTIDFLRNVKGKTWEEIIESSFRTGGKDLGY